MCATHCRLHLSRTPRRIQLPIRAANHSRLPLCLRPANSSSSKSYLDFISVRVAESPHLHISRRRCTVIVCSQYSAKYSCAGSSRRYDARKRGAGQSRTPSARARPSGRVQSSNLQAPALHSAARRSVNVDHKYLIASDNRRRGSETR